MRDEPDLGSLPDEDPDLNPFDHSPGEWFYATPSLVQRLDLLVHLLEFSQQVILVLAEEGYGKTAMIRQLHQQQQQDWDICLLNGADYDSGVELIMDIASVWGLQADSVADAEQALRRFFVDSDGSARLPVLILDDAQHLPDVTLNSLLELATEQPDSPGRLRAAIFSDGDIVSRLGSRSGIIHTLDIEPLTAAESTEYLRRAWQHSGQQASFPFAADDLEDLHELSAGVPQLLNRYALERWARAGIDDEADYPDDTDQHLSDEAFSAEEDYADEDDYDVDVELSAEARPWQAEARRQYGFLVLAAAMISLIIGVLWLLPDDEDDSRQGMTELPLVVPEPMIAAQPEPPVADLELRPEPMTPAVVPGAPESNPEAVTVPESEPVRPRASEPEPEPETSAMANAPSPAAVLSDPGGAGTGANSAANASESMLPPVIESPAQPQPQPEPRAEPEEKPEPVEKPATAAVKPAGGKTAVRDARWLQSVAPERFVLQVFASDRRDSVDSFLKQYQGLEDYAWYRTWRNGKNWYVVVAGNYPDKASARAAIAKLPQKLRQLQPWVRSVRDVHIAILKG